MSSLKSNLTYQSIYQFLSVCIPLVTSPYLSRVLGAEGLGIYSYNYSIVSYFMLFALLGVNSYGMRSVAQSTGKEEISKRFFSIYYFQLISSAVSLIAYIVFISIFVKDKISLTVSYIHILYLIGECININWLFFGLEKYKTTVIRNVIIKVLTVISIFVFVRKKSDVINYISILAICNVLSNIIILFKVKECVTFVKVSLKDIKKHIKPNLLLFVPVLAASIYHVMDKTMLGMFSTNAQSGYYYNADKLLNIPLTVIVGCSNVFMSRISSLVHQKNDVELQKTRNDSIYFGMCVVSAIAFGVFAVSREFVPWFFGAGYEPCISLIKYFSLIVVIKTIAMHTRSAFLIPEGSDKSYAKAITSGGAINFVVNYVLIAMLSLGALGATLATLISEIIVAILQIVFMNNSESRKRCIVGILKGTVYLGIGLVMLVIVEVVFSFVSMPLFFKLITKSIVGGAIYLILCLVLWIFRPDYMPEMFREIIYKVTNKVKKHL